MSIQIADLPHLKDLTQEQLKELFGAGRFRPGVEGLEDRLAMSTVTLSGGVLGIMGANNQDVALVRQVGNMVHVDLYSATIAGTPIDVNNPQPGPNVSHIHREYNQDDYFEQVSGLVFRGFGGDDYFHGGAFGRYYNQAHGGTGNDTLIGGHERNELYGNEGDDTLTNPQYAPGTMYGGPGDDTIYGSYATDYIYGEDGRDKIYGGYGNDYLYGGRGTDVVMGGEGYDVLYGDEDVDYLSGGGQMDTLRAGPAVPPWIWAGRVSARATVIPTFFLATKRRIVFTGVRNNDSLFGGADTDSLYGYGGRDMLKGEGGVDYLYGGTGNDDLYGGDQDDFMHGEAVPTS